jgi:hypothetical protein
MNALDVMEYGHLTVLGSIDGLDDEWCSASGVCGVWSVKDIFAHLASYEVLLADVLVSLVHQRSAPLLDHFLSQGPAFNDAEVDQRNGLSMQEALAEYNVAYDAVSDIAEQVPMQLWRGNGTLPWYGEDYSLDDWIVYQFYGHKREHAAQIAVYRDVLVRNAAFGQE